MKNIDLKWISSSNRDSVKKAVLNLQWEWITPHLNVILIWDNESAVIYSNTKKKVWETLWIKVTVDRFSSEIDEWDIKDILLEKSNNSDIHWIMIESPVPNPLCYDELINVISPLKDVDWLHTQNLWMILTRKNSWILPSTPLACISILEKIFHDLKWLKITLVWHWKTVWWPLSNILSNMCIMAEEFDKKFRQIKKTSNNKKTKRNWKLYYLTPTTTMSNTRSTYSAEFKAKIALIALSESMTISEICTKYEVHAT